MCECIRKYITILMKISISNFVEVMKKFTQVTLLLEVHTYRPQWLGPIVQNKKKTIKIQCNHANNSRLRNLFVRILFLLLFNGDRGMKSLKENSCCGFVVAVLQSCVAWIFFSKCSKKPTVKSVLQIFLLHDWYGELLMFHSRGIF